MENVLDILKAKRLNFQLNVNSAKNALSEAQKNLYQQQEILAEFDKAIDILEFEKE